MFRTWTEWIFTESAKFPLMDDEFLCTKWLIKFAKKYLNFLWNGFPNPYFPTMVVLVAKTCIKCSRTNYGIKAMGWRPFGRSLMEVSNCTLRIWHNVLTFCHHVFSCAITYSVCVSVHDLSRQGKANSQLITWLGGLSIQ